MANRRARGEMCIRDREKTFPAHISLMEVAVWESPAAKVVYRP